MPTVPQPPQAVRTEKSLSRFRKSRGSFFASGYTSLDGLFRLCRMVIKQARKRDLLTQLLQDGGAGKFKSSADSTSGTLCRGAIWLNTHFQRGGTRYGSDGAAFPPFFHSGAAGTAQGGAGTSEKVSPAALAGTGKPTVSAWDKSVTFLHISGLLCFCFSCVGTLGGRLPPVGPSARGKKCCAGYVYPHTAYQSATQPLKPSCQNGAGKVITTA